MSWERRGSRADSEGGQQPPPAALDAKRGGGPPEPPPALPFCALDARFAAAVKDSDLDTATLTLLHQVSHVATAAFQSADAEPKLTDWTSTGGAYFLYDSGVIQRYHDTQGKRNFAHGKKGARGLPIAVIKNEDEEPYAINNPKATGKAADEEAEKRMQEAAAAAAAAEVASVGTSVADEARAAAAGGGKKRRRRRRSLRRAAAAAAAASAESGGGEGGAGGPGSSGSGGGGLTIQQYIRKGIMPGEGAAREVAAYLLDHGHVAGVPPTALALARHPGFYVSKRYRAAVDTARATHEAAAAAAEAALHSEAVDTAVKLLTAEQQEAAAAAAGGAGVGSDSDAAPAGGAPSVTATPAGAGAKSRSRRRKGASIDLGGSDSGPGSPALQGAASIGPGMGASAARPGPIAMGSDRRRGSCVLAGAASPQSGPVAASTGTAVATITTYSVAAGSAPSAVSNVPPLSPRAHLAPAPSATLPGARPVASTPSSASSAAPAPATALASSSGAGVEGAAASLVSLELPPIKAGSLQIFVPHICTAEEMASTLWPVEEVQKLAILDIRLCNTDRNDDNILIRAYFDGDPELAEIEALERKEAECEEESRAAAGKAAAPAASAPGPEATARSGLGLHSSSSGSLATAAARAAAAAAPPASSVGRVPTIIRYWQKLLRPVVQADTLCKCDTAPGSCLVAAHVMRNAERRRRFERLRQLMTLSSSVLTSPALTSLSVAAVEAASLSGSSGEGGKDGSGAASARVASPLMGTGASKQHIALVSAAAALVSSLPTSAVMDTDGYPLLAAAAALSLGIGAPHGTGAGDAADIDGAAADSAARQRYAPITASAARANIAATFSGIEGLSFDDSDVEALLALQDDDGCGWADLGGATPWHGGLAAAGRSPSPLLPGSAGRSASSSPALGPSSFLAALVGKPAGVVAPSAAAAGASASLSLPAGNTGAAGGGSSASLLANFLLRNARQQPRVLPTSSVKGLSLPGLELGATAGTSAPALHVSIPPLSSSPDAPLLSAGSSTDAASTEEDLGLVTGDSPAAKATHPTRLSGPYNTAGAAYVSSQYGLNPASLRIAAARGAVTPMLTASTGRLLHGGAGSDTATASSFTLAPASLEAPPASTGAPAAAVPATPAKGSYVPPHKRAEMLRAEAAAKEAAAAAEAAAAEAAVTAAAPAAETAPSSSFASSAGSLALPSLNIPSIARSASFRDGSSAGVATPASSPISGGSITGSAFTVTGGGHGSGAGVLSVAGGFKPASRSTSSEATGGVSGGAAAALCGLPPSLTRTPTSEATDAGSLPPGSPQPRASLLSMLSVSRQSSTTASLPSPAASLTPAFGSTASAVTTPGSMTGAAGDSSGGTTPGLLALGSAQSAFVQQAAALEGPAASIPTQLPAAQPVSAPAPAPGGAWRSPRLAARLAAEASPAVGATPAPAPAPAAAVPALAPAPAEPVSAAQRPRPSSFDSVNGELSGGAVGASAASDASRPASRSSLTGGGGWTTPGGGSGSSTVSRAEALASSLLSEPPPRSAAAAAGEAAPRAAAGVGGGAGLGAAAREDTTASSLRPRYEDEDEGDGDDDYDDDDDTYRKLKTAKRVELVPIDHGLCLPSINGLDDISCSWVHWRQTKQPLSPSLREYVMSLDGRADALLLRAALGDRIRPACLLTLRVCTALLQEGVRAGLTLEEVGKMMLRGSGVGWLPPHHPSITGAGEEGEGAGSDGGSGSFPAGGGLRARRDGLAGADGSLLYEPTSHWHNQRSGHHSHPSSSRKGAASTSGSAPSSGRRGPGEPEPDAAAAGAGEEDWSALEQAVRRARKAAAKERRHILARAKAEAHNAQVLAAASAAAAAAASGSGPRGSMRAAAAAEAAAAAAAAAAKAAASAAAALSDLGDAGVEILQQVWGQSAGLLGLPGAGAAAGGGAGAAAGSGALAGATAASKQAPWNVTRAGKIHKKEEKRRKRTEAQRVLLAVAMEVQSQMQGGGEGEGGSGYEGSGNGSSGPNHGTTVGGRTVFKKGIPSTATFGALPHPYVSPTSGSMSSPSLGPAAAVPMGDPFSLDGEGGSSGGTASSPKASAAPVATSSAAAAASPASSEAGLPAYIAYHDLIVKNFVLAVKPHIQAVVRNRKQTH